MRMPLLTLIAVLAVGCSGAGASASIPGPVETTSPTAVETTSPTAVETTSPTVPPEPTSTAGAAISVTGDPATGASDSFALAGGSYDVAWKTTADTAGCSFLLVLATTVGGPSVKNGVKVLSEAKAYNGTFTWIGVLAGTYVLQEDRSGFGHCAGPWSATVTPR